MIFVCSILHIMVHFSARLCQLWPTVPCYCILHIHVVTGTYSVCKLLVMYSYQIKYSIWRWCVIQYTV